MKKKYIIYRLLFVAILISLFVSCVSTRKLIDAAPQLPVNFSFEGKWIISGFTERGTKTYKNDGEIMTITKKGDLYYISSPDWVFDETKFRLEKPNELFGETVQDYDSLKELFTTIPDSAIRGAANSKTAIYRASLTVLKNGQMYCQRSNGRIVYDRSGRFSNFEIMPEWIKFTLTRQQ